MATATEKAVPKNAICKTIFCFWLDKALEMRTTKAVKVMAVKVGTNPGTSDEKLSILKKCGIRVSHGKGKRPTTTYISIL
jgi:hypothetical protein